MSLNVGIDGSREVSRRQSRWKRAVSVVAALAMSLGLLTVGGTAALALPSGITAATIIDANGNPVAENAPLDEGTVLTLEVDYTESAKGQTVDFKLGPNATLGSPLPAGTSGIEKFELVNGDTVRVTFHNDENWPSGTIGGAFGLKFALDNISGSGPRPITWTIGGDEQSLIINVRDRDEVPPIVIPDTVGKSVAPVNLDRFVKQKQKPNGDYEFDFLDPAIANENITYTLTVNIPDGQSYPNYSIRDQLPAGMQYVGASGVAGAGGNVAATATLTQYAPGGVGGAAAGVTTNPVFAPAVQAGDSSFAGTIPLTGPATLTVTYQARIVDVATYQNELAAAYNGRTDPTAPGDYGITKTNTATFGPTSSTDTADFTIEGTVPGPCPSCNGVFGKSVEAGNWTKREFTTDVAGNILPEPADISYRLNANLGTWDGQNPHFTLNRNVVITDTLPAQASWKSGAGAVSLASGSTSPDFSALTLATGTCDAATIASDANIGRYCLDGQTLRVNVGKHKDTNVGILVNAQLNRLADPTTGNGAGLIVNGNTNVAGAISYRFRNTASFTFSDSSSAVTRDADVQPIQLPQDRTPGLNDSDAFTKAGPTGELSATAGEAKDIPYRFTVKTAKTSSSAGIVAQDLHLVDHIDLSVFDVTADALRAPNVVISGSYAGATLDAADFELSLNRLSASQGDLTIKLTQSGKDKVAAQPDERDLVVDLSLRTRILNGKETLDVKNVATLYGTGDEPAYWSEHNGSASSWGDELEARKRVWDSTKWNPFLKVAYENGKLSQPRYAYEIELLGHGSYNSANAPTVLDHLPANVDFVGFITSDDPAVWSNPQDSDAVPGPVTKNGIEASYDDATRTITIDQKTGRFPVLGKIPFRFVVEVNDGSQQVVNSLLLQGQSTPISTTTVDGISTPGVDIEKWSDEGPGSGPEYDANGALLNDGIVGDFDDPAAFKGKALAGGQSQQVNFTVSNNGPDRLVDLVVSDVLTAGAGQIQNLVCEFPDGSTGTTWAGPMELATQFDCSGTLPGLKAGQSHRDTATVSARGEVNGATVVDNDVWNAYAKSYAVGDYTWIDKNKNGKQDAGEPVLPGVKVELLNERGEVVATTKTDDRGFYKFDLLDAGTYQVRFTLTEEQGKRYRFTTPNVGDAATDSDALTGGNPLVGVSKKFVLDDSNAALTRDYANGVDASEGIDPTWDAGVIEIDPVSPLSVTGSDIGGIVAAGLALLALGGTALTIRRRRATA
ncbi:SdrD B-like domain-containing protein [Leucobacter chironomi]|uniref:SdrD B-like domain-containing protein n=1 Tax=Leucobacter chironomi TaxID=491918 RepID=UPI0012685C61|nr:SdrD B-like domain-containing protein [Leucobacter chironomi]